jgi:anthranilate synthase/aminodeoxychorismate synthase-like glutamine amidotransferase
MAILILDNYDSFTFNLYQFVQSLTEEEVLVARNDAIDYFSLRAMSPSRIIISPGPGHPANILDFGVCAEVITNHAQLSCPILGVCLGHQGIGHFLGGKVTRAPLPVHGKSRQIEIVKPTKVFDGLPKTFEAMRYHSLVVSADDFPCDLEVTARDCQDGLIMAIEHKDKKLFGVQFHPESIGTPHGKQLMENFIHRC